MKHIKKIEYTLSFISILLFIIVLIIAISIKGITNEEKKLENSIYPNVFIDNQNVGTKTKQEVTDMFHKKYAYLSQVQLETWYGETPIATFSAEQLNIRSNIDSMVDRAYLVGRSSNTIQRYIQKLSSILKISTIKFNTDIEYNEVELRDFITGISDQYAYPAKNALFTFENNRVSSFRTEENGLSILTDDFLKDSKIQISLLKNSTDKIKIVIKTKIIPPEVTLSKINSFGIEEYIAEGKSNYSHSMAERIHNLTLGASKFNGVLMPKGKVFSFNETIGDISSLTGYKPAYIIKAGKTVLGDGGGVCQVSTTLFRAALNAGLPVVERNAHAYRVIYYENDAKPGFDATVYAPYADLKILNNTPTDILIQTEIDKENNILFFRFYGKKDYRKVEISPATVYDVQPPPPAVYQDDPTLKKGVQKQVDFPAWGAKSFFTYKVTLPNNEIKETKFFSSYTPWHAVFLNGTAD